jgi:DnaJ-class molecular chaperone
MKPPVLNFVEEMKIPVTLEEFYNGVTKTVRVRCKVLTDDGLRTTMKDKDFTINIKKGWKCGYKCVFPKEGDQELNNPAKDVVFVLEEIPHPFFKRDKNNLTFTHNIDLCAALTGSKLEVKTLDDRMLFIGLNEVITPDYKKTITGEGMPLSKSTTEKGNLIISFEIAFPSYLNGEQKELIKKAFNK